MGRTSSLLCQIHMQSCILAGGVAVGVSMSVVRQPWEAMTIGFTAAVVSTIGLRYLKVMITAWTRNPLIKYITAHHKLLFSRSTCCVHSSAMTPALSWAHMGSLVYWDGWHISSYRLKTVMITQRENAAVIIWLHCNTHTHKRCDTCVIGPLFCRAIRFAVFHICTLFITIALSLSMGIITGKSSL